MKKICLLVLVALFSSDGYALLFSVSQDIEAKEEFRVEVFVGLKLDGKIAVLGDRCEAYHQKAYRSDGDSPVFMMLSSSEVRSVDLGKYTKFVQETVNKELPLVFVVLIFRGEEEIYRSFFNSCEADDDGYLINVTADDDGHFRAEGGEILVKNT